MFSFLAVIGFFCSAQTKHYDYKIIHDDGAKVLNIDFIINYDDILFKDTLYTKFNDSDENFYSIKFFNTSSDTIYLFDSYFNDNYIMSEYLHRYDKKSGLCKISLLPLLPYLDLAQTDRVIIGENRIISRFQVLYNFKKILPFCGTEYKIRKDVFDVEYVKDFNMKNTSSTKKIKFKKIEKVNCKKRIIEFAFYYNIDFLDKNIFYYPQIFDIHVKNYEILSIEID